VKSGYSTYKSVNIDTADQGKLILIAYDVAIKHCKLSLPQFADYRMIEERSKHLVKAQDAVSELMGSLRMEVGEISRNLHRVYEYMLHRLVQANVQSDKSPVEEVLRHLESLRDAWSQAFLKLKRESAPALEKEPVSAQQSFAISG